MQASAKKCSKFSQKVFNKAQISIKKWKKGKKKKSKRRKRKKIAILCQLLITFKKRVSPVGVNWFTVAIFLKCFIFIFLRTISTVVENITFQLNEFLSFFHIFKIVPDVSFQTNEKKPRYRFFIFNCWNSYFLYGVWDIQKYKIRNLDYVFSLRYRRAFRIMGRNTKPL